MHCQCKPNCEAVVKTRGKLYARGHNSASHIFTQEQKRHISKARRKFFANGGESWWSGKHHFLNTKIKLSKQASKRMKKLWKDEEFRRRMENSDAHYEAQVENGKLGSKKWRGQHHSKDAKRKIGKAVHKARKEKYWLAGVPFTPGQAPWNKGLTKDTDGRVAAYAANMIGHPLNVSRYQFWYPNDEFKIIRMRSSWEVALAHWLNHFSIPWEYEPKSFYVGKGKWNGVTYTPDFYLPEQDEYIEVKGWYSSENKRKMKKFRSLYPDIKLYVFFQEHLGKVFQFSKAA